MTDPTQCEFRVKLFAAVRQAVGSDTAMVTLATPYTAARLRAELAAKFPAIAALIQQSRIAIDAAYALPEAPLNANAEIALIPPVSGG